MENRKILIIPPIPLFTQHKVEKEAILQEQGNDEEPASIAIGLNQVRQNVCHHKIDLRFEMVEYRRYGVTDRKPIFLNELILDMRPLQF